MDDERNPINPPKSDEANSWEKEQKCGEKKKHAKILKASSFPDLACNFDNLKSVTIFEKWRRALSECNNLPC